MDRDVVSKLAGAGLDTGSRLSILIMMSTAQEVIPVGSEVLVSNGEASVDVELRGIRDLFVGDVEAPDFSAGPTAEYESFFMLIELTAADYCSCRRQVETDQEFERLYRLLGKKPDGRDANPLYSYLRAACRVYMSVKNVSNQEFSAVLERLRVSARTFGHGSFSRNYWELALAPLVRRG